MSEDISLAEALSLAERFTNVYKAFAKIQQVLDKARQVEGQRDSLWAEIEAKTNQLQADQKKAVAALEAAQQEHAQQLEVIEAHVKHAKESANKQIAEEAERVRQEVAAMGNELAAAEAAYKERSAFLDDSIKKLEEREEVMLAEIDVLEKKKAELMAFFAGIANK